MQGHIRANLNVPRNTIAEHADKEIFLLHNSNINIHKEIYFII